MEHSPGRTLRGLGRMSPLLALPPAVALCGHLWACGTRLMDSPLSAKPAAAAQVSDLTGCPQPGPWARGLVSTQESC